MSKILMTPGPTTVPDRVLRKMSEPVLHHRTDEYSKIFSEMSEKLKYVFRTKGDVLTFTSSGTGAMESSIVNMFSRNDKVLVISTGVFGDRFAKIAEAYGVQVDLLKVVWGKAVSIEEIKKRYKEDYKGIIVTHNETSTAVVNPIKEIGDFMKDKEGVLIVDSVSGLGGVDIRMDEWNIDVLITASQKALMSPPGLAFVGVSDKAWRKIETSDLPKFYWDYKENRKFLLKEKPFNPFTPAVSLVAGVNEALSMIQEEGLENVLLRHEIYANRVRNWAKSKGLVVFGEESCKSNNVTPIMTDRANEIKKKMSKEFNIEIAGAKGELSGKMIRIGHMGYVTEEMITRTIDSLDKCFF
ncbi:pyridoxal-phosphate-dependent aminotransferase family protein [Clostridium sp. DL1XJH146]